MIRERRRARKENTSENDKGSLYILTGLIIGLLLGLVISLVLAPTKFIDASPESLRSDLKDEYRLLIATAYHSNHNLPRAEARLNLLSDPSPILALTTQAQVLLKSGDIDGNAFYLAFLADALKNASLSQSGTTTRLNETPIETIPFQAGNQEGALSGTQSLTLTVTSQYSIPETITATQIPIFILKSQQILCDSQEVTQLLMIEILDASNQPIPGIEIIISWMNGEEHIFTGLIAEKGEGYADYLMTPNIDYGIRFASGGASIAKFSVPSCTNNQGETRMGGLKLIFQQP